MGWTAGALSQPFTALAAIEFDLGEEFATQVIDTARYGTVIYAAVRSRENQEIWGLVLLAERRDGLLLCDIAGVRLPAEERWRCGGLRGWAGCGGLARLPWSASRRRVRSGCRARPVPGGSVLARWFGLCGWLATD
jgi:hypothetical protein